MFSVIARHHDGKTSIWHVAQDSIEDAKAAVTAAIIEETKHNPTVVLACIKGGKA